MEDQQRALVDEWIAATAFTTNDTAAEHPQLRGLRVKFRTEPTDTGHVTPATFEDACGTLRHLAQPCLGAASPCLGKV